MSDSTPPTPPILDDQDDLDEDLDDQDDLDEDLEVDEVDEDQADDAEAPTPHKVAAGFGVTGKFSTTNRADA